MIAREKNCSAKWEKFDLVLSNLVSRREYAVDEFEF